jgi:tetratricopeptide (TPR) repeat protein
MRPPFSLLLAFALFATATHAVVPWGQSEKIRALLREKKIAEAESAARALVAASPQEAEAHALLGSVCAAKGDADGALKAAEKATELAPKNGDYHRQLGEAYGQAAQKAGMLSKVGLGKKALAAFEKAVELEPNNLNARASLATVYSQAPSMMGGGMDKAYAQAAALKQLDDARGRLAYASLYTTDKKYTEAFAELEEVLKNLPENYAAHFQIGRVAALSGERIERGMEALKKCLSMTPAANAPGHDAAHWRLGMLHEKKGDKAAARAAYQSALKVTPNYPQAVEALKKLE